MSRTQKGAKGPGYDYWSRRLGNDGCQGFGPDVKKKTHRMERREAERIARAERAKHEEQNDDG